MLWWFDSIHTDQIEDDMKIHVAVIGCPSVEQVRSEIVRLYVAVAAGAAEPLDFNDSNRPT